MAPSSVLIIGSGVFGLSTADSLAQSPAFNNTKITVVDRAAFPAPDAGSVDSSRLVRSDYSDVAYAELAREALSRWRGGFGGDAYSESGFAVLANDDGDPLSHQMVKDMIDNEQRLGASFGSFGEGADIVVLNNQNDVRAALPGFTGTAADSGYVNYKSGWAHAENGLRWLRQKVKALNRIQFKVADIKHLIFDGDKVLGAQTSTGGELRADLTILAAGAWSGKFIDLRGITSATGQPLAYISVSDEEQARLLQNPAVINPSNYMYILPPRDNLLKIARHSYGWSNPQQIDHPEKPGSGETIEVSLPRTKHDNPDLNIPLEADQACRSYLTQCIPELAARPWLHTRICWYSDTQYGDWLIDYHPHYNGLFVATGGSGHGYKFLPVIGQRIVDVITKTPSDTLGEQLTKQWQWPKERADLDYKWTHELRGGPKGMILDTELAKKH